MYRSHAINNLLTDDTGRIVLAKIHNEESLLIANVDCMIGESEMRSFNYLNAFVAFQRCYRTRYFALGAEHYSTALAKRLLNECRDISGTRYYCGMELKDRIYELQWLEYNQRSQQNIVAIFINRMADDVILTSDQLENVVHTSFSFHENLTNSLMKKDARYNMEDFEHTITVQEVLLLLATQSPPYPIQTKPVLPTSPPGESKKTSAAPTNTISKLLNSSKGVERPKQLTPARASSFTESKTNENRLTSTSRLGLSSPKHISNTAPSNTNATSGEPNAVLNELQSLSVEDSVVKSQSETETKKGEDAPLIRIPSELSIKDTAGSGATTPSSSSSKQRTWRKIPMSSPLRRAANPNAGFSNIDLGDKNYHIARSDASGLIFVRKCSADVLRQAIRSKVLAVGLFAWYCGGRTLASKAKQKAGAAEGGDANSALNALFGKKGAPPSSDNNAGGSLESKEDQPTNGPKFAKSAPRPPPVPTSWPPIPFTPDEAKTDAAAAGGDDKDGDAPSDPSAPPKPKLKQVFLTSLASIEGTFWSEPLESFIAAEELFDDIEEEFAIGGPKKQKLPFGAASKAPPKAVAKAAKPTETVLDPQRGQNINIMLAKFGKKSLESIAEVSKSVRIIVPIEVF